MKKKLVAIGLIVLAMAVIWATQRHSSQVPGDQGATAYTNHLAPADGFVPVGITAELLAVLDHDVLPEASGLAVSGLDPQRLWLVNDSGSRSELVALDLDRKIFTRVNILDTPNEDWEDIEVFSYNRVPWIVVADVGDNKARRDTVNLYFLPEPGADDRHVRVKTTISLAYPGGPRDVESVAVDPFTDTLYLLSKREPYPRLYAIELPELGEDRAFMVEPVLLGEVRSIPAPTEDDLKRFPKYGKNRNQPTAMSHVPDGRGIALLTYGASYFAPLGADRNWLRALNESLCPVPRPELKQPESIAADAEGRIYITSEGKEAPVLRLKPGPECFPGSNSN